MRKPIRLHEIADKLVTYLSVHFVYEDEGRPMPTVNGQAQATLDLTGLPADWVASLRQATMEADAERIMALAEQIRGMVYPPIFQAMIKTRCAD